MPFRVLKPLKLTKAVERFGRADSARHAMVPSLSGWQRQGVAEAGDVAEATGGVRS